MAIMTPKEAIAFCAEEAVRRGFIPDNPQMAARMRAIRSGKPIDENEVVAEGGCDHPDPALRSVDPSCSNYLKTLRNTSNKKD